MKRTLAALTLLLALTGCRNAADPNAIRFRFWGDVEEVKIIEGLIRDFEAAHPGIKVKAERKPDPNTYADNLMTEFASQTAPDVIFTDTDRFDVLADGGKFADLGPFLERETDLKAGDFYEAMTRRFTQGGKLRVLPRDIAPIAVVYYNKDLFDAAKLPYPKDDWTWDQMRKAALALTQRDEQGRASSFGFADDWNLSDAWILAGGGKHVDDYAKPSRLTFAQGGALDGLLFRWRLIQVDQVMPSSGDSQALSGGAMAMFLNGQLGMFHSGLWKTPAFRKISAFQWDVAPFPRKAGVQPRYWSGGSGYAMRQGVKDPEACWKLIKYMAGPEGQRRLAATGLAQPALKALARGPEFLDGQAPANKKMLLACAEHAQPAPAWLRYNEFGRTFYGPRTDEMWLKGYQGDPKALLQGVEKAANEAFFPGRP